MNTLEKRIDTIIRNIFNLSDNFYLDGLISYQDYFSFKFTSKNDKNLNIKISINPSNTDSRFVIHINLCCIKEFNEKELELYNEKYIVPDEDQKYYDKIKTIINEVNHFKLEEFKKYLNTISNKDITQEYINRYEVEFDNQIYYKTINKILSEILLHEYSMLNENNIDEFINIIKEYKFINYDLIFNLDYGLKLNAYLNDNIIDLIGSFDDFNELKNAFTLQFKK